MLKGDQVFLLRLTNAQQVAELCGYEGKNKNTQVLEKKSGKQVICQECWRHGRIVKANRCGVDAIIKSSNTKPKTILCGYCKGKRISLLSTGRT